MADEDIPRRGQPQQINLNEVAQQFMAGLQRHFDLLAFNLAAHDAVREQKYDSHVNAPKIMPSAHHHQNFEQLQAYARDLLTRQVINDSLTLSLAAMNNAHFFLSLIRVTNASKEIDPEAQKKASAIQQEFIRAKIDEKFNRLEKDYDIMCELEDSIISLGLILQVLVKQNKIVRKEQLDNRGKLVLELKSTKPPEESGLTMPVPDKLVDIRKIFREGDLISFDDMELKLVLITIASFADSLFKSVATYARSVQKEA